MARVNPVTEPGEGTIWFDYFVYTGQSLSNHGRICSLTIQIPTSFPANLYLSFTNRSQFPCIVIPLISLDIIIIVINVCNARNRYWCQILKQN